jgi:hypothetical protein
MSELGHLRPIHPPAACATCPLGADSVEKVSEKELWN